MAEAIQLDKAAAMVGKSEVTLRRLIKAGKIPFEKQKTLTGFIYLVNPDHVKTFYKVREGSIFDQGVTEATNEDKKPETTPTSSTPSATVRVAVAGDDGGAHTYWQKRSELYEDRYNTEVTKHSQTREELGAWRGRAEQAQSMLMKLLPAPSSEVEVKAANPQEASYPRPEGSSTATIVITILLILTIALIAGAIAYVRLTA